MLKEGFNSLIGWFHKENDFIVIPEEVDLTLRDVAKRYKISPDELAKYCLKLGLSFVCFYSEGGRVCLLNKLEYQQSGGEKGLEFVNCRPGGSLPETIVSLTEYRRTRKPIV